MGYEEEMIARDSETREKTVMMPSYEGADAREEESEGIWRVHVYTVLNPKRPYVTFEHDDRNTAVRRSTDIMSNGIVDLDGEFIPRHRIHKAWIQEPRVGWQVQEE